MIRLSKLTDYAVAVLVQLSKEQADGKAEMMPRSAHFISEKIGVPEPTVAKVLKVMSNADLIDSVRGGSGGYRLKKTAAEVSIAEIITAIDGPIAIVSCVEGNDNECVASTKCPAIGKWDTVNRLLYQALDSVKLSQMQASSCGKIYDFLEEEERKEVV